MRANTTGGGSRLGIKKSCTAASVVDGGARARVVRFFPRFVAAADFLSQHHQQPQHHQSQHNNTSDSITATSRARSFADLQALVQLRRRARHWLDATGWGRALIYADGTLSALSVLIYIMTTYQ